MTDAGESPGECDGGRLSSASSASTDSDELEISGHEEVERVASRKRKRPSSAREIPALPLSSIVKVLVKKAPWTYTAPWRKESQKACSGSGFLLGANQLVITGAHVVHRATSVIVQAQIGAPAKYAARVVCVAREVDLAILKIDSKRFWSDKIPLEVRAQPCALVCVARGLQSNVVSYGDSCPTSSQY